MNRLGFVLELGRLNWIEKYSFIGRYPTSPSVGWVDELSNCRSVFYILFYRLVLRNCMNIFVLIFLCKNWECIFVLFAIVQVHVVLRLCRIEQKNYNQNSLRPDEKNSFYFYHTLELHRTSIWKIKSNSFIATALVVAVIALTAVAQFYE